MTAPPLLVQLESTHFPCEKLQITSVKGKEGISQLFRFEISFETLEPDSIDVRRLTGSPATLVFIANGVEVRRQHGMIAEATDLLDSETHFGTYRVVLVPRSWQLTLIQMQEIYLTTSVPDIIRKKAELLDLTADFEFRLLAAYPEREFVVQYQETDLAFITRLSEHLGMSFFFDQSAGRDRMIFTDHRDGFQAVPGAERVLFRSRGERQDLYRLDLTTRLIPALYAVSDYNYENPQVDLTSTCTAAEGFGGGVVEYGTNFKDQGEGQRLAAIRAEERMMESQLFTGASAVCTLTAGARVGVDDHPRIPDCELLIVEVEHHAQQAALGSSGVTDAPRYTNTFKAIPAAAMYRPPRVTPRPRIYGVTNGVIDTDPGVQVEHPWIDQHGRYIVRMLFDTSNEGERKASLPIRMAQSHSGPSYGMHFPLRPGTEVLVTFVDGDPDRPLIIGSVPNAITPTPVNNSEFTMHRMRTWSGVLVEIDDGA